MHSAQERRRQTRTRKILPENISLYLEDEAGGRRAVSAKVLDTADSGLRVRIEAPLDVGAPVYLEQLNLGGYGKSGPRLAHVMWCSADSQGRHVAGLCFETCAENEPEVKSSENFQDHYEVLQLSHKATPDTVHRVYRMMAQRLHPDNPDTGNEEEFKKILEAYRVLSDPERRAAYDAEHFRETRQRWKVFSPGTIVRGREMERRLRAGILAILYARRVADPARPGVGIQEMEEMLGCPREHLEFSLWFLKEKGFMARADNGRFSITVQGVEQAEAADLPWNRSALLPKPAPAEN